MTDSEKIRLIKKIIYNAMEFFPEEGDAKAAYFEGTLEATRCVAEFGEEDDNDE